MLCGVHVQFGIMQPARAGAASSCCEGQQALGNAANLLGIAPRRVLRPTASCVGVPHMGVFLVSVLLTAARMSVQLVFLVPARLGCTSCCDPGPAFRIFIDLVTVYFDPVVSVWHGQHCRSVGGAHAVGLMWLQCAAVVVSALCAWRSASMGRLA